jgi:hypothetical protein
LQSQGIEGGSVLHLLLPLLGGGDRNDKLKHTQETNYSERYSGSNLWAALKATFKDPTVCEDYARKLEENHLTSVDSLQGLEEDDLVGIGLTKLDAKRLLRQCSVTLTMVCVGDYSNEVGVIRLARYMKLSDVRRISHEDRLPLPTSFQFVCGPTQTALTEQQEATWDAYSAIHRNSLLVREGITLLGDKLVGKTKENCGVASLLASAEIADQESSSSYEKESESSALPSASAVNHPGLPAAAGLKTECDVLEKQCKNGVESPIARECEQATECPVGYGSLVLEGTKDGSSTDGLATESPAAVHGIQQISICATTTKQQSLHWHSEKEDTDVNTRRPRKHRRRKRTSSSSSSSASGTCYNECKATFGSEEGASVNLADGRSPLHSIQTISQLKEGEKTRTVLQVSSEDVGQLQVGQDLGDASYQPPSKVAEAESAAPIDSSLQYQQSKDVSDLGHNMRTSLLGNEVDALIANCNPYSSQSSQVVAVSWLYVQTRKKRKRFVLFEVHVERSNGNVNVQGSTRMKSLKRYLKDNLHVKGTGGLSLVKNCKLYQSMGPFEVLGVDPEVGVIIDSTILPNQRIVYKIRFDKGSTCSIYSLKLGDWLQERATAFMPLDYPLRITHESSEKVVVEPIKRPCLFRKPKASFQQFKPCHVQVATHIIIDETGRQKPIQVRGGGLEDFHKALHGYKQKSIPFCCQEIMTSEKTLLVQRFIAVDPSSSDILLKMQQVVGSGQKHTDVSAECIVCSFGDGSFHVYWPRICVSYSDGQEIRDQIVQKLSNEYPDRQWDTVVDECVYDCQSLPIVGSTLLESLPFAFVGSFGSDGSLLKSAKELENDFLSLLSSTCLRQREKEHEPIADNSRDNTTSKSHSTESSSGDNTQSQWRPFGRHGYMWKYVKGSILPPEGRDREYKSLNRCPRQKIAFKVIQHSVKFICGCLNIRQQGTISFGIGDKLEQQGRFRHGEVIGLAVEAIQDEIQQLFQHMLDNMIYRDDKCGMTPYEQLSVSIHFVRITPCLNENPLVVVEVEVDPQWSVCKDCVYIYKQFEKKERTKSLKEVPDNWHHSHDYRLSRQYTPTLRKAGISSEIDWPQFMIHKRAIEDEYKEYKRAVESTYNVEQVDVDLSGLSSKLRQSLRNLDCERHQYILVSNAVPGHMRDKEDFSFFSNVPWIAVVDFDPSSENGGLQDMFKKKAASGNAVMRQLKVMDATYGKKEAGSDSPYRPTSLLTWIFANGRQNVSQTYHTYSDWVGFCKKGTEDALLAHIRVAMSPIVVFALLSTSSLQEMAALVQYTYSLMVVARAKRNIVVLSDDVGAARKLTEFAGVDVRECCVAGLPWDHVKINLEQMLPELAEESPEKYLLSSTGTEIPVPNQRVRTWDELDVISSRECEQNDFQPEVIERIKLNFYKGEQAEWLNFFCNHDIERCIASNLRKSLLSKVDALRNPNMDHERGYRAPVRVLTIYHYPGTGGTTLCRRLLWDFRKKFRCALIKSITETTARQVQKLYEFGEMQTPPSSILPVILMVDSVLEHQLETFCSSLHRARLKIVIIHCKSSPTEVQRRPIDEDLYYCLDRKLEPIELNRVANIVVNLEKEPEKRVQHITNIKRDKQIIYFGLQLFGQEYNQKRLATFVKSHLDNICELEVQMLKFCSLVYSFRHTAVPRACIRDLLVPGLGEYSSIHVEDFSEATADLLVSSEESIDNFVFLGYRPAHHLVGVEILNNYVLYDTTRQFLEKMLHPSASYARTIIEVIAIGMLTRRDEKQDFDDNEEDPLGLDGKTSPDRAVHVAQKVRENRFPRLVMDILTEEGVFRTLDILLLLWRRSSVSPQRAYLWQHIARFLAHEIGFTELSLAQTRELLSLLSQSASSQPPSKAGNDFEKATNLSLLADSSVCLSGFDAALKAIDQAIEMIPDRSVLHGTRGTVFKLQLAAYRSKRCSVQELSNALKLTQLSCDAFTVSRNLVKKFQSWYPQVGESEVCIEFLRIVKEMDLFQKYLTPTDRKAAFRALLEGQGVPNDFSSLSREQLSFIQTREQRIRSNLDEIFECEDLSKGWEKGQRYEYQRTRMKGAFLRRSFIEVSDSYSVSLLRDPKGWESNPELRRQMVEEMLYNAAEHPYSSWMNFEEKNFRRVVELLRPLCLVDYSQLISQSDTTILMFVRACIEMRGERSVSVNELVMVINNWCRAKPQNAWAHLFQYMVYFPLPNLPSTTDRDLVNAAISCCRDTIMNRHHVPRRSKPKYFVGKGEGLDILVPAHKVSIHYYDATTQYWRSKGVVTKLQRLKGTKLRLGRIMFNSVEISFDNDRFPGESKDWLWFYLGFTIQGPYAYDPVDANEYEELNAIDPATLPDLPLELSQSGSHGFRPDTSWASLGKASTGKRTASEDVATNENVTGSRPEELQCVGLQREPGAPALHTRIQRTRSKKDTDLSKCTSASGKSLSKTEIRITGLNAMVKDKDLRRQLEHFGKVKRVHRKSLDLAFVEFEDQQSANQVVKKRWLFMQGCKLSVKRAYCEPVSTNQPPPTMSRTEKKKSFNQSKFCAHVTKPITVNQESTNRVSHESTPQVPTLVISNLPGPPDSDQLFDLLRTFDEKVVILSSSETIAEAHFDSLEKAEAAQRQICSFVNKVNGRRLGTEFVNTSVTTISHTVEDLDDAGNTKIESFQRRLQRETRHIQDSSCLKVATVLAPLVTDSLLLQTLGSFVVCEGCQNPMVYAKLCSCLNEQKISVPVSGGRQRQKVTFREVLTDMCNSEFASSIRVCCRHVKYAFVPL